MAVFGYTRVSTIEQTNGTSLEEQARTIHGVALIKGTTIAHVFEEQGVSGSVPLDHRPVGMALVTALGRGDMLIVAKLDRAFRSAADALSRVEAWKRSGIDLVVADMGTDPVTEKGVAKLFFGMLALVAEFERDRLSERMSEGRRAKAAKGGHIGGSAPFGYQVIGAGKNAKLSELFAQQEALASIRALRDQGLSLREIAAAVRAGHGIRVSHETVRRVCQKVTSEMP